MTKNYIFGPKFVFITAENAPVHPKKKPTYPTHFRTDWTTYVNNRNLISETLRMMSCPAYVEANNTIH